jgi:ketosteroid isomerase-like protein
MTTAPSRTWCSIAGGCSPRFPAVLLLAGGWTACLLATAVEGRCAEPPARGVAGEATAGDAAAIRSASADYRAALMRGDAAAIRRAWTDDGDVVDGWGNVLTVAEVTAISARPADEPRPEIRAGQTRLRFITPDVAVEDGVVDVVFPGTKTPLEGWFSALWARRNGEWKLAGIREAEHPAAALGDRLEDLEWMVGEWVLVPDADVKEDLPAITMTVRWDVARMFLLRDVRQDSSKTGANQPALEVHQRIGWDPLVGRIRSWSFAADGSRSEATWFRDGTSWVVKGAVIHPDGRQTPTVNIYSFDGKDRCTWRTMEDPLESSSGLLSRATWTRQSGGPKR